MVTISSNPDNNKRTETVFPQMTSEGSEGFTEKCEQQQ